MKSRTRLLTLVTLVILILGITWLSFSTRNQEPAQTFPATVNRDCAPWDGAAFTISIPYNSTTIIQISIWQAPDIKLPSSFVIPDDAKQIGYAYIQPESGPVIQLNGDVSFQRVEVDTPVEGRFSFTSERGGQFEGEFKAEWGTQVIMCG